MIKCILFYFAALLLLTLTTNIYFSTYSEKFGFTKMIWFGTEYFERAIPEVRNLELYVHPDADYDGQFYVQEAIDPSLRNPGFDSAIDVPAYRMKRILLPLLSHLLGLGKAEWVVQAYCLMNGLFWIFFGLFLMRTLPPNSLRSIACMTSMALGSGVIFSINRALTDFPAAVLILWAMTSTLPNNGILLSAATLTRESSILSFPLLTAIPNNFKKLRRTLKVFLIFSIPILIWSLYVLWRFPRSEDMSVNIYLPFHALSQKFLKTCLEFYNDLQQPDRGFFDIYFLNSFQELAMIASLILQAAYMILRRNYDSPIWRAGALHVVLLFCLGPGVWEDSLAAMRSMLPLSFAFNLLLLKERPAVYIPWFLATNICLPEVIFLLITRPSHVF